MLETEMDSHLGYDRYERSSEPNYRNGTKPKTVRSKYGEFEVDVLQNRQSSIEPQVLPKRQKDISLIDDKIISMYAKGMTTRQISETIEDIYGFEVSEGKVMYDDSKRAAKAKDVQPKEEPAKKAEKCTTNTDNVDREIEKLKEEKKQLEQQIKAAAGDKEKVKVLGKKLARIEGQLSQKDNDTYRRQNAVIS